LIVKNFILSSTQTAIGYCEQTPFLQNGSTRDNIIGHSTYSQRRYDQVLDICLLRTDLDTIKIGSNGIMLCGGQNQRVSLARALYLETDFLLIDGILSGLDNSTGNEVFQLVFGPNGLIRRRGTTAVLCTHTVRYLPLVDHVIALQADGTVSEEGTFGELLQVYVHSLGVSAAQDFGIEASTLFEEPVATMALGVNRSVSLTATLEGKSRATGDSKVYRHCLRNINIWVTFTCILASILYAVGHNFPFVWMGFRAYDSFKRASSFYVSLMGLFGGLQVVALLLCCTIVVIFMTT
ncbi:P-loop containing nucleoside triphosphate hydrolase protein, partial [Trichoderma evansii]